MDSSKLEQVLINLLSNASKFSPDSGTIKLKAIINDHDLQIDIEDKGIGIPADEQASLFQPYHRAGRDRQQIPGLGLGLAVSRHIVEAHGGKIWLVSRPGEGSTFSFSIPRVRG
jgi:two-component system, OmpR family, phosphate regulon sensor histidine kinase PhoR